MVLAEEAEELGLVNRALPPEELLPFTLDYARRMAAEISPSSLRVMKRQLWDDMAGEVGPSVKFAVEIMERMVGEPDFAEGVAAFQARRPPAFGAVRVGGRKHSVEEPQSREHSVEEAERVQHGGEREPVAQLTGARRGGAPRRAAPTRRAPPR